ncbi:2OG-Fe(II) oxygenase [Pleurostoma richardsiae]|uniref:2OG-Fe(II) oxygenase n=1 Tax=Pleurostoma richardsiae TaxID=41990 RepID=A0AA38R7W7_9PEZI|nr:2OG-Fe(II) oxygenase [Pleurostoma richardsiae]
MSGSDSESDTDSSSDASIGRVADTWKTSLLGCLNSIESSGDFAICSRHERFANPGIQLDGNRIIPLPLAPSDAEAIKRVCRQAPFGKGSQTVVDTSVRNTWELDPSQFELANPAWESCFSKILQHAADGLGLLDVTASLHKLLLYEEGSFFKRHKDSEKETGMVGTLVVCLPSQHEGGDVLLSFKSEQRTFATAPSSAWDITALAWFSDVTHEVSKLKRGYRLVLTYKLIQIGPLKQSALFFHQQSQDLQSILLDWKYTESSLSLANMKGRDRAVCQFLYDTCSDSGVFLALAHITRSEVGDEDDSSAYQETFFSLDTMYSWYGTVIGSNFVVNPPEILNFSERDPDSSDEAEYTGNEDAPPCFRYHDTVAMLVPKRYLLRFLAGIPRATMAPENMVSMVDRDLETHQDAATRSAAIALLNKALHSGFRTVPIVQTAAHWAVEFDNKVLYRAAMQSVTGNSTARRAVLETICRHIEEKNGNISNGIAWDAWFEDLERSCSLESWQLILEQLPGYLISDHLKVSFTYWAQTKLDRKFDSKPILRCEDHTFLIRSIETRHGDSEWITTTLLPALSSRGERKLLYNFFNTICKRRQEEQFSLTARIAFDFLFEHASGKLLLHETDLHQDPARSYTLATVGPCEECTAVLGY